MSSIVDRRKTDRTRTIDNRKKFIKRYKKSIKKSIKDVVIDHSIKEAGKKRAKVKVSSDTSEPTFTFKPGTGDIDYVLPGNKHYKKGGRLPKKKMDGGKGGGQGQGSGDTDEFSFVLDKSEVLDLLFDDMELPDFVKDHLKTNKEFTRRRAGFTLDGDICRLDIKQTMKNAMMRKIAAKKRLANKTREEMDEELEKLTDPLPAYIDRVKKLNKGLKKIPYLDEIDVRYRDIKVESKPSKQAVMFCLMDVSGSMTKDAKELAKKFYILLHLFLEKNYDDVEVVFVRHTEEAKEVEEEEFFYSRETGGTIMSSGLKLIKEIIEDRYDLEHWNIYIAQCSDGDNFTEDDQQFKSMLLKSILPMVQYYAYIQIGLPFMSAYFGYSMLEGIHKDDVELYPIIEEVMKMNKKLQAGTVVSSKDIYPVLKKLFKRKNRRGKVGG